MGTTQSKRFIIQFGISAAAFSAFLYILFGPKLPPSESQSRRDSLATSKEILGLYNYGTTCYLNSILQALASCHHYVNYVNKYNELAKYGLEQNENDTTFQIVTSLAKANHYINRDLIGDDFIMSREIPKIVLSTFKTSSSIPLATNEEQDAHEVFNIIINALVEEQKVIRCRHHLGTIKSFNDLFLEAENLADTIGSHNSTTSDTSSVETTKSRGVIAVTRTGSMGSDFLHDSTNLTEWNNPFLGRFAASFQCLLCAGKMPIKFEEFNNITLNLPPQRGVNTLTDLIQIYFVSTIVHDVDCENCSKNCGKPTKSPFCKSISMSKLPRSLCLHINRAQWEHVGSNKRLDFIPFEETIDLGRIHGFMDMIRDTLVTGDSSKLGHYRSNCIYKLMSVISHRGDALSGHFVTYRRGLSKSSLSSEWYIVSDRYSNPVPTESVFTQHAYMLFYERMENPINQKSQNNLHQ